jgi:peptidoglycan/xylan/chitin deacetylase (PgdA/CDA1 family)
LIHFYKTPGLIKKIFSNLVWDVPTNSNEIFLTFDDGPIPKLTSYVLEVLHDFDALATFFCVGDNISKNPDILEQILAKNHLVGNHTHNHLKGWSTSTSRFVSNAGKCQEQISKYQGNTARPVFRPPHGQITFNQVKALKANYNIVMWDILAYDYDTAHSPLKSLDRIISKTKPGSIVVFHDNYKAEEKLKFILPTYLKYFKERGFSFKKLDLA